MFDRMSASFLKRGRSQAGAALVELAVASPLLILILVGTIDFARVFYTAIELTNAARAGAEYAAHSVGRATSTAQLLNAENAAIAAAPNLSTVTAAANPVCSCLDDTASVVLSPVACSSTCVSGHLVVAVTVTATRTFTTVARFPGVPNTIQISRSATLRAVP